MCNCLHDVISINNMSTYIMFSEQNYIINIATNHQDLNRKQSA